MGVRRGPGERPDQGREDKLEGGSHCEEGAVSTARPGGVGEACMLGPFICPTCPHAGPGPGDTGLQLPPVGWRAKQLWNRA